MIAQIKFFGIALVLFLVLDFLWIGLIANNFYIGLLGDLARLENGKMRPLISGAVVVYMLLAFSVVVFPLAKLTNTDSLATSFLWGAFFGLSIYGVYDFTNYSTLAKWPLLLSIVDACWGGILCGTVTLILKYLRDQTRIL
jgi:uncharacterized membrane protein